ncbi:Gfo/Idh/MocA family oxidoreductase [Grimontia hollisae]|uniref:Putative oxidoreductase n=1 Tax=Grimontia hollisae TaxID=673 RepID=A0A377HLI3_GRIHO|nr:Gfo/Idh/MocA family oxidoreductase [Grimontia hollisae]MDF2183720.1 Gfo/Idh/MocA family oxidoreductase [Grimontia hollisae]STO56883.1 putative oxidoreductase [Grimontia hollisae]STQ74738.1 putative oxidoreductase [Grimontia hollisae]
MIWLIGSGLMSVDYAKVLDAQDCTYQVIGRGSESAKAFTEKTGKPVICGGLAQHISMSSQMADAAIVSVGVAQLYETTKQLIKAGVKKILVEKPGSTTLAEIEELCQLSAKHSVAVYIAYNRRFYSSVQAAKELIQREGGVTSFHFEFTEWSHIIKHLQKPRDVLNKWFLANSTHVTDLAFFLGGKPKNISCYISGSLEWHDSSSVFSGAGVSTTGALFSYNANWESAGRWSLEVLTKKNKYIFQPVESLKVQKRGELSISDAEVDYKFDMEYKPGLYHQVKSFLDNDENSLCSLCEQAKLMSIYNQMAGYK